MSATGWAQTPAAHKTDSNQLVVVGTTFVDAIYGRQQGVDFLLTFLDKNFQLPIDEMGEKTKGKVYISFSVDSEGHINNIDILKDIGGGCAYEVVRVLKLMPDWIPNIAIKKGKTTKIKYTLHQIPIEFKISYSPYLGIDKLLWFLNKNFYYSADEMDKKIKGRVYISFDVKSGGIITNIKILKDIGDAYGHKVVDALNLLNFTNEWCPYLKKGKAIKVKYIYYQFPIEFKISFI
jgi:hypothetical protein